MKNGDLSCIRNLVCKVRFYVFESIFMFFFAGMGKMLSDVKCKDIPRYSKTD